MKILLAIDGSSCSKKATETLVSHYRPQDAEVVVMNVVESAQLMPVTYGLGTGPVFAENYLAIEQTWRAEAEKLVADVAAQLEAAGFKTTTRVEDGDARERILDYAQKWRADLILLGSHGWKGLDRFLLGSVSEAVARQAKCSVEIVRAPAAA